MYRIALSLESAVDTPESPRRNSIDYFTLSGGHSTPLGKNDVVQPRGLNREGDSVKAGQAAKVGNSWDTSIGPHNGAWW